VHHSPDRRTADFYSTQAHELVKKYSLAQPEYLDAIARLLNGPGATVLDVGCGTGRDIAWLLDRGFETYGIDASRARLDQAIAYSRVHESRVARGALCEAQASWHTTYDAVLGAAAQHLPDGQMAGALSRCHALVSPGGYLVISVPTRYETDADSRDKYGRVMHVRPASEHSSVLEGLGMLQVESYETEDGLGRSEISWKTVIFRRPSEGTLA